MIKKIKDTLKEIIEEFLILLQFMTRIPIFIKVDYSEKKLGEGIKLFPLVGMFIGSILYTCLILLSKVTQKVSVIAFLLIIIELLVVGLIHLDGLADTFDGLFSYAKKEKMLEIMKDSRIGTNGAVILILYFLAKFILISEILRIDFRYLIIYPVIARLSTSLNAAMGKYARETGMSNGIIEQNNEKDGIFSLILTYLIVASIFLTDKIGKPSINGLVALGVALIFILLFRKMVYKKIDGITGDTLGASLELTGIVVLLVGVILK